MLLGLKSLELARYSLSVAVSFRGFSSPGGVFFIVNAACGSCSPGFFEARRVSDTMVQAGSITATRAGIRASARPGASKVDRPIIAPTKTMGMMSGCVKIAFSLLLGLVITKVCRQLRASSELAITMGVTASGKTTGENTIASVMPVASKAVPINPPSTGFTEGKSLLLSTHIANNGDNAISIAILLNSCRVFKVLSQIDGAIFFGLICLPL